jgi:hypothetical protein
MKKIILQMLLIAIGFSYYSCSNETKINFPVEVSKVCYEISYPDILGTSMQLLKCTPFFYRQLLYP